LKTTQHLGIDQLIIGIGQFQPFNIELKTCSNLLTIFIGFDFAKMPFLVENQLKKLAYQNLNLARPYGKTVNPYRQTVITQIQI
jgi:hypothetical protein